MLYDVPVLGPRHVLEKPTILHLPGTSPYSVLSEIPCKAPLRRYLIAIKASYTVSLSRPQLKLQQSDLSTIRFELQLICADIMRGIAFLSALCAAAFVQANFHTAHIYIQPVENSESPTLLAELAYDPSLTTSSSIISYEAPEIPDSTQLVRVGLYDPKSSSWISGTTVASVDNFGKGFSPNLILSIDENGEVLSAALKGVRIDAGQTRDFGPQAVVLPALKGKQPELNKPVVLSPEGKKVEEEEKTFLQKYVVFPLSRTAYGSNHAQVLVDDWHCGVPGDEWRRRRREIESPIDAHININSSNKILGLRAIDRNCAPMNYYQSTWIVVPTCQRLKQPK